MHVRVVMVCRMMADMIANECMYGTEDSVDLRLIVPISPACDNGGLLDGPNDGLDPVEQFSNQLVLLVSTGVPAPVREEAD